MKTFNYSYPVNVYFGEGSAKTAFSNELKKYGSKVVEVLLRKMESMMKLFLY